MSVLQRGRNAKTGRPAKSAPPAASPPATPPPAESPPAVPPSTAPTAPTGSAPLTRTAATWIGICVAAFTSVVLIVFMLQNTGRVEVSFLWMHGHLPLALALLIAGVGTAILTMVVGTARITQLRGLTRRQRQRAAKG